MKEINNIILSYFAGFGKGDITQITENFDENVSLTDWSISCRGLDEVRNAIQDLLSNGKISIYPESIFFSANGDETLSTCLITINIRQEEERNESIVLKVVDLITIKNNKIVEINAYKQ